MSKYNDLVNILDSLRAEAPESYKRYHPTADDDGRIMQARARAFIHLFLKVKFGLTEFLEREAFITDDPSDGGVDAYYIDNADKVIYLIQSKFRNSDANFQSREITLQDILAMDINRILDGEETDEYGTPYNDKILAFINEISEISDIPKYTRKVILLANVKKSIAPQIKRLTGGYNAEIYNFEKVYNELVFPLISGAYYNIKELKITLNVDKDSAGHRIQYYPETKYGDCTVNALYVPTIEIAKILSKYKNSILKYNPRSYLDLQKGSVNTKIANSIENIQTNEFALFNNGITMLSDETEYSDKVGKRNKAEVIVTNPQIINGGQTAYTLSIIYDRHKLDNTLNIFEGKEVLLKIISFDNSEGDGNKDAKLKLIEDISIATNQQSPVYEADRRANDAIQIQLQKLMFQDFGLYYERKRGEFGDGIRQGYILRSQIVERERYLRICLAANGDPIRARSSNAEKLFEKNMFDSILPDTSNYRKCVYGYMAFEKVSQFSSASSNVNDLARYAIACVVSQRYTPDLNPTDFEARVFADLEEVINQWPDFEKFVRNDETNKRYYFHEIFDPNTGERTIEANWGSYYKGRTLNRDINEYFREQSEHLQ